MDIIYIICVLLIALLVFLIYGYVSNYILKTTHYTIESKELYNIIEDKPIVILADLHNCKFGKDNSKLIKAIDSKSPAYVIVAGDLLNRGQENDNHNALELITYLRSRYNVIYSDGNHEQGYFSNEYGEYDENKFTSFYSYLQSEQKCDKVHKGTSFCHLGNSYIQVGNVRFYGLRIATYFFGRYKRPDMEEDYVENLLGKCNKDYYNVLIAHNPLYFSLYEKWGANLVISGHVHGGILRLPFIGGIISPQIRLFPKYTGGLYTINKAKMILSRGLGTHTIRFRFFNPPELVVVHSIDRKR